MAELQGLGAHLSQAEKAGVEIVAVSPDPNERSQKIAEGLHLGYRFLADRDLAVTRRYGLVHAGAGPNGQDVRSGARVHEAIAPGHREVTVSEEAIAEMQPFGDLLTPLVGIGRDGDDLDAGLLGLGQVSSKALELRH